MMKSKLTEEQKVWRRREQSAARKNAKVKAEIPLFADQVPKATPESEYWHWRKNVANSFTGLSTHGSPFINAASWGMKFIQLQAIERLAQELCPAEFEGMRAHIRRVYPDDYWRGKWLAVLSGREKMVYDRTVVSREPRTVTFSNGTTSVIERVVMTEKLFPPEGWIPPITYEELERRFPVSREIAPAETPDDGGAAAMLAAVFDRPLDRADNMQQENNNGTTATTDAMQERPALLA